MWNNTLLLPCWVNDWKENHTVSLTSNFIHQSFSESNSCKIYTMSQFTENFFLECSFQYRRIYTVGKLFHSVSVQLSLVLYSTPFPLFRKYLWSPVAKKQRRNIDMFSLMMHPSNCVLLYKWNEWKQWYKKWEGGRIRNVLLL